jgi:NADH-ubiquinone oxidoreductase chain 1
LLFCVIFLGCNLNSLIFYIKVTFISYLFIWVRGTLPRFRYDKLMYLAWKSFLPLSLNYLLFFLGIKLFLLSFL